MGRQLDGPLRASLIFSFCDLYTIKISDSAKYFSLQAPWIVKLVSMLSLMT